MIEQRTRCAGRRVDGKPCTRIRLNVEWPWWCRHHEAQDGKKRLVSAVVPRWATDPFGWNDDDDWDDEYGIIPREY